MKKLLLLLLLIPNFVSANTYIETKVNWFTFKVIEYDLSSTDYDIKIARATNATTLDQLMLDNNAITWVNWVFFCPKDYAECGWKTFTRNEAYIEWNKLSIDETTWFRTVFWWTKDKVPMLFQSDVINADKENELYYGFANHPLLLKDWEPQTEFAWEAGLIDKKMVASMARNFICSDKEKKHIYFWYVYNPDLDHLAWALKDFGCYDALNLDAGWSIAYEYNGRMLAWPWRQILDWVMIERKDLDVNQINTQLDAVIKLIDRKIKNKTIETKIRSIDSLITQLNAVKTAIYNKNSSDVYSNDETTETSTKIGYRIDMNSFEDTRKVYIVNRLVTKLTAYKKTLNVVVKK